MKQDSSPALGPLGSLYMMGLRMDRYLTEAERLPAPVISVGNISVGGRGKTPFVIEICRQLRREGFSPVVLTRGYGRGSRRPCRIDLSARAPQWDIACGGDEALETAYFGQVPVLVGARRLDNARDYWRELDRKEGVVFVLDDGFQHWKIKRDFDLVLVNDQDFVDRVLPLGRLREPVAALSRANLVLREGVDFTKRTHVRASERARGRVAFVTTRAPNPAYRETLRGLFPNILALVLTDHAREGRIRRAVERSRADTLVVGAKEAVKLFSREDFSRLVTETALTRPYAGRERLFLWAECELEVANAARLWEGIRNAVTRERA